jgi:2-oxoglutarate dehydrogenase E2 component (dihydrolipoamide succinyltransferase)
MVRELKIPQAGESIQEVQIGQWLKQEGEWVGRDENVVELETDKASVDLPAPVAGVLAKILKRDGEAAAIGDTIALIDDEAQPETAKQKSKPGPLSQPPTIMPAAQRLLAEHDLQGSEVEPTGPGGRVLKEDVLRHLEKLKEAQQQKTPEVPADQEPAQAEPQAEPERQEQAEPRQPETPPEQRAEPQRPAEAEAPEEPATPAEPEKPAKSEQPAEPEQPAKPEQPAEPEEPAKPQQPAEPRKPAEPERAKRPEPRERVEPAEEVKHAPHPSEPAAAERALPAVAEVDLDRREEVVPMTLIRRRIAENLVRAQQQAALLTTFNEIDMTEVIELRQRYREPFQDKYGVKLGFVSFFCKAAIEGLKEFPALNARIREREIVYRNYYDIGIAIGGGRGLVVPALRSAERMSFAEIESNIADFAQRAKANKIRPEELEGGTFTITNGGIYGSLLSTPIINPPQSGVLGLHAIQERPVAAAGQVVIRPMMYVALSYDHRIVDGREAVTFLKRVKEIMEEPARMLLEV